MHRIARDQPFRSWYVHLNFAIGTALISAVLYALGPTGHVVYAAYLITPLQAALYLGPTEAWQALALNLTGFGLVSAIRAAAGEGGGSLFFQEALGLALTCVALVPMRTWFVDPVPTAGESPAAGGGDG